MCGIVGLATSGASEDASTGVRGGLTALAHRGPDACGIQSVTAGSVTCILGATRLRIIDLSIEADQPLANEDGTVRVVYNGELYNFRELQVDLERSGHRFRTRTDTEVLVHLYEEASGDIPAFLGRLRGMFAFAIFDVPRGRLLLARDRLGIKPLYVASLQGGGLAFASEARALAASGQSDPCLNPAAVTGYLRWGIVPGPDTIFSGIRELPPGSFLRWESNVTKVERWWSPVPEPDHDFADATDAARVLSAALQDSVARHLVAERPVGVFLSSGLDSGAVAKLAAQSTDRIRTLTVTFPDVPGVDEGVAAAAAARALGADHREVPFTAAQVAQLLPEILRAMDQPTWDAVNTWIVCRAAREEGLVVCLSGLGGDELFGGYPSFQFVPKLARARAVLRVFPPTLRRGWALVASRASPGGRVARALSGPRGLEGAYAAVRGLFAEPEIARVVNPAEPAGPNGRVLAPTLTDGLHGLPGVGFLEMTHYLPNQLLRDTDAVSMAHSLEVRVPLLDDVVTRVTLALPEKVRFGSLKGLLARATGLRPPLTKHPFALPMARWLNGALRESVREGLLSDELPLGRMLDRRWRRRVWNAFVAGRVHWSRPWAVAVLRLWPAANGIRW